MINVLVTGAEGQLGRSIQKLSINYPGIAFWFKNKSDLDISKRKMVNVIFENGKFDYCINCAAYTNVEQAERSPDIAYSVNTEGVKNLVLACKKYKGKLIHISTDFVFDGEKANPYLEEDSPRPLNVYGASKLGGEIIIKEKLDNYFVIRTSWLYSENGNNFVKTILKLGKEQQELRVVNDQFGTPTYAGDLALVILGIIKEKVTAYGLYHYSNEGETNWYDYALFILEQSNMNIALKPVQTKDNQTYVRRPKYSVLDSSKIKNKLNIEIPYWRDSLRNCINNINSEN